VAAAASAAGGVPEARELKRYGVERARAVVAAAEEELDALTTALVALRERVEEAARLERDDDG